MRTTLARDTHLDPATWPRIETLKFISDHPEPKMKDIADYLSISAPSATALIRGLVKNGLVSYVPDREDRRMLRLRLTFKGKAELAKAITRGIGLLGALFSVLSPRELAVFTKTLERLKEKAAE